MKVYSSPHCSLIKSHMKSTFLKIVWIFFSALLSGCAATVVKPSAQIDNNSSTTSAKIIIPRAIAKTLIVRVDASTAVKSDSDWDALIEEWEASLKSITSKNNISLFLLKSGDPKPQGPATYVQIKVKSFKYVSQVKRIMIGVFAGNASLDVDAEFFELPEMKTLGVQNLNTSSSFGQGMFSAMTPKQVNAVAAEIVNLLEN